VKTVLLLRHAKSDRSDASQPDFDRPLTKRGLTDAARMGKVLADFQAVPDKILSSSAQRAKQTAELAAKACGYKEAIEWHDSFYSGDNQDLIHALQRLPNTVERAMLVGHNPTMEETAATLLLGGKVQGGEEYLIKMPTAGLVCLELSITSWAALKPGRAILTWFLIPRLIEALKE
jgi:phosphohistidine phosphatase